MKRIIISAMMLLLIKGAFAQHVEYGIKGGVNFANISNDAADTKADTKTGFHLGGLAHIHLNRSWAICWPSICLPMAFDYRQVHR